VLPPDGAEVDTEVPPVQDLVPCGDARHGRSMEEGEREGAPMDIDARPPVVVAIGDEDEHAAAVRFAAAEAVREVRPLRVVHVVHAPILGPGPEQMLLSFENADMVGDELLAAAVERAEDVVAGRVPVTKKLWHGPVVPSLVEAGEQAHRVVLQHRQLTGLRRVLTGSVCAGVAAHAQVPVVSVPELWTVRDPAARLVVGVDDTTGDHRLLEPAFALAAEREASLVVLHAWYIPSMYAEAMRGRAAVEEAREKTRFRIAEEMAVWQAAYPAVDAQLEVSHARPADALLAASQRSDLLVLGRRSGAHAVTHLGSVTRALVRESRCPVMVLPPTWRWPAELRAPSTGEHRKDPRA
jgi:nucleotide-binding universal stress UspA family protein